MSERSNSPISDCNSRPYDFSPVNPYAYQALVPEGVMSAGSIQLTHGALQDQSLFFNKTAYNGMASATAQAFFPFPPVSGVHDLQAAGDYGHPKHWYPFAAPEAYTGQVPGVTAATQPANISLPIAETREQIKMPEVKTERDSGDEYSEIKIQQYPTPQAAMAHGVYYSTPWNPSFWPGLAHIMPPTANNPNLSTSTTSSPSLSPSPPSNGVPGNVFFSDNASQPVSAPQNPSTRSSGSSSGACSDSEEEVRTKYLLLNNDYYMQSAFKHVFHVL